MSQGRSMRDVLRLNVAGEAECAVLRSTLCIVEDSMLCSRFSGRWDDSLEKDDQGRFFIDFAANLFLPLLDFLRQKAIEDPYPSSWSGDPPLPKVPEDKLQDFNRMAKYYGVDVLGVRPFSWLRMRGVQQLPGEFIMKTGPDLGHFQAGAIASVSEASFIVRKTSPEKDWYHDTFRLGLVTESKFDSWVKQGSDLGPFNEPWLSEDLISPMLPFSTSSLLLDKFGRAQDSYKVRLELRGDLMLLSVVGDGFDHTVRQALPARRSKEPLYVLALLTYGWIELGPTPTNSPQCSYA